MTQQQIKQLKEGDIITWKRPDKDWNVYGRILIDGTLFCDIMLGDGDGHIMETDAFFMSEPGWIGSKDIHKMDENDEMAKKIAKIMCNA